MGYFERVWVRHRKNLQHGFTVLELSVVLIIGTILAVLLVFAVGQQRSVMEQVTCMNNMRKLFTGLVNYSTENNGRLPKVFDSKSQWTWATILGKSGAFIPFNTSNFRYYSCPFAPVMEGPNVSRQVDTYGRIKEADGIPEPPFILLGPNTPILCDSAFLVPGTPRYQRQYYVVNIQTNTSGVDLRHRNRANIVFADGHGEALTRKQLEDRERFPPKGFKYFREH